MLVLTRQKEQSLLIGDDIKVTVLAVEGDKVKLGISAPREVTVLREELHQAVKEQDQIATRLAEGPEPNTFKHLRELLQESLPEEQAEKTQQTGADANFL